MLKPKDFLTHWMVMMVRPLDLLNPNFGDQPTDEECTGDDAAEAAYGTALNDIENPNHTPWLHLAIILTQQTSCRPGMTIKDWVMAKDYGYLSRKNSAALKLWQWSVPQQLHPGTSINNANRTGSRERFRATAQCPGSHGLTRALGTLSVAGKVHPAGGFCGTSNKAQHVWVDPLSQEKSGWWHFQNANVIQISDVWTQNPELNSPSNSGYPSKTCNCSWYERSYQNKR